VNCKLTYVLITPARNEEAFIEQTIQSVISQTILPLRWVIVSDGSTDGTDEIVNKYLQDYPWIELIRMPERQERHFAGKVYAFNAGYERVKDLKYDIIGSLDADISFAPDYFDFLLAKFGENPKLGVGGTPFKEEGQQYDYRFTSLEHVSGACQLFRRECFEAIGGYNPLKVGGIDLVAVITARMKGWQTRTFTGKISQHHRKMGAGMRRGLKIIFWSGYHDYLMGVHIVWQLFRSIYQMRGKPLVFSGLFLFTGYLWALMTGVKRPVSNEFVEFRRREQMRRLRKFWSDIFTLSRGQFKWNGAFIEQSFGRAKSMEINLTKTKSKEKPVKFRSTIIHNKNVVVTGKWIKRAVIQDEAWLEGEVVEDPDLFIARIKYQKLKADIFSFVQKLPQTQPRFKYYVEWDNVSAIPITSYQEWWEKRLPQVTRKSVRRGLKRGVVAKLTEFDDELVKGIVGIHNDTLMKQGEPFAHYGKEFSVVKQEYGTYLDRCEFLGAYYENELIGVIKIIYMGKIASIMQILSKERHYDKRPTNVLIAKAVEVCEMKGISFLVYGKHVYGNKTDSSLTEFKRRNGFEQINVPRYYIPLTPKGRIIIKLKLHRGLVEILPGGLISFLLDLRSRYYQIKQMRITSRGKLKRLNYNNGGRDVEGEDG
jgi:glycosyltransferase involved in cell wall biosynthesis